MNFRFIVLFLCLAIPSFAQEEIEQYVISEDLKYDWVVFDASEDSFVPYRTSEHKDAKAHSLVINTEQNKSYVLLIKCLVPGQNLFINGSLYKEIAVGETMEIPIATLKQSESDWGYITIFGSSKISDKKVYLGYKKDELNSLIQVAKKDVLQMKRRGNNPLRSMTVFTSIFMLVLLAFTSGAYPRAFTKFVDFFGVFTSKLRETAMFVNKPFSRINMAFLLLLTFSTGFLCWCFYDLGADTLKGSKYLLVGSQFWVQLVNFFILCIICGGLYFVKMIYIRLVGSIFGLGKIVDLHFFKLVQISLSLFLPFSLLFLIYIFSGYEQYLDAQSFFFWATTIFYLIRMVAILFALNTNSQIQFHYLITYLCVVELIPLVLGLRFVL